MVSDARARWDQTVVQPFVPPIAPGVSIPSEHRVADALEYIAAQMGRISAALEKIDQRLEEDQVRRTREQVSADTDRTKAIFGHPPE